MNIEAAQKYFHTRLLDSVLYLKANGGDPELIAAMCHWIITFETTVAAPDKLFYLHSFIENIDAALMRAPADSDPIELTRLVADRTSAKLLLEALQATLLPAIHDWLVQHGHAPMAFTD